MRSDRRIARLVASTLAACMAVTEAGGEDAGDLSTQAACHAFTPDGDYIETTVIRQLEGGEVTLRVPAQYFENAWDRAGGYRDTAQLFRVEIGSFEPVSRRETGLRNRQGIWNWMHFVVADNVVLPQMAANAAEPFVIPNPAVTTYAMRPGKHGLTWLDTPFASDKVDAREDVFIDPSDYEAMTTMTECTSTLDPTSQNPRCQQSFRAAGLDVQLFCDRTELRRWQAFQAQVTAFLTCAIADPA